MFVAVFFAALDFRRREDGPGNKDSEVHGRIFYWPCFRFYRGYPLGWAMNYYAFGTMWEGIPFAGFTDNKTQIVLFYLVFLVCPCGVFAKIIMTPIIILLGHWLAGDSGFVLVV